MKKIKIAVIQMNSGHDKERNLRAAVKLLNRAIARKANFILLPETFNFRGNTVDLTKIAENIPGLSTEILIDIARKNRVYILGGSIYEKSSIKYKFYNSSVLIDEYGKIKAVYRKMHLFDVSLNGRRIKESKIFLDGRKPILSTVLRTKVGLSICYDLRFPELYRKYSELGAKLLCVPSSFTITTGQAHWETLLRARAIENQCFILAPNQYGVGNEGVLTYGNSMVIDPWGEILVRASGDREEIIYAELDIHKLDKLRESFPVLKDRLI